MNNKKLVTVITSCPECGGEKFYVDKYTSKTVQCKECGTVTEFTDLFTAYIKLAENKGGIVNE